MSKKAIRALEQLSKSVAANTPKIESKLSEAGVTANAAFVFSTAKYYRALNKLAKI
jgi:hypothetical protein